MRQSIFFISIFIFLFLSFSPLQELSAQSGKKEDVITLKDGTLLYGWILDQEVGKFIRLELVGGSILVIEQEKISEITRLPSRFKRVSRSYNYKLKPILYRELGLYSYVSPQFSFRNGRNRRTGLEGSRMDVGIHLRVGYRIRRYLALGMGVGIDNTEGGVYMPIYLDISGDVLRRRVTPHYQISVGYSHGADPTWPNDRIEGGFTSFTGIGYKIHTQSKLEWTVVGGYKFQDSSERGNSFSGVSGTSEFRDIRRGGITLQISIGF